MLRFKNDLQLVLGRENWKFVSKNINVLAVEVSYKNVAFQLMFKMLCRRGNSKPEEQINLNKKYIEWFEKKNMRSLSVEEFVDCKWL